MVRDEGNLVTKPPTPRKYETTNTNFKVVQKVNIKKSAKTYDTGESVPARIKGKTDTIMQRGSNRIFLTSIYSWVKKMDVQ